MINLPSVENRVLQAAESAPAHVKRAVARMNNKQTKVRMRSYCKDNGITMCGPVTILTEVGPVEYIPEYRRNPKAVLNELKLQRKAQKGAA